VPNTKTDQIAIVVNGVARYAPDGVSLVDLLGHLGIAQDRVAIELNGTIVKKQDWAATRVDPGAKLEIVQFVGGG
jgi:sulfur carrier protein